MLASQSTLLVIIIGASVFALAFALWLARWVLRQHRGKPEMQRISDAIQQGAEAFLARQYRTITGSLPSWPRGSSTWGMRFSRTPNASDPVQGSASRSRSIITISFRARRALSSGIAGYVGMWVSIRANIRTAAAALSSLNGALQVALRGGAVAGLFVVAMSLLGVAGLFAILTRS